MVLLETITVRLIAEFKFQSFELVISKVNVVQGVPNVLYRVAQMCCTGWPKCVVQGGPNVLYRVAQMCCTGWPKCVGQFS